MVTLLREDEMYRWGLALILGSCFAFVFGIWAMIISPFTTEDTGNPILDSIKYDSHYKYLILMLIPMGLYTIIINWMGFKIFRHA